MNMNNPGYPTRVQNTQWRNVPPQAFMPPTQGYQPPKAAQQPPCQHLPGLKRQRAGTDQVDTPVSPLTEENLAKAKNQSDQYASEWTKKQFGRDETSKASETKFQSQPERILSQQNKPPVSKNQEKVDKLKFFEEAVDWFHKASFLSLRYLIRISKDKEAQPAAIGELFNDTNEFVRSHRQQVAEQIGKMYEDSRDWKGWEKKRAPKYKSSDKANLVARGAAIDFKSPMEVKRFLELIRDIIGGRSAAVENVYNIVDGAKPNIPPVASRQRASYFWDKPEIAKEAKRLGVFQ